MNTQIDLSKACIGQYITLANGKKYRIGSIHNNVFTFIISSYCNELSTAYKINGKDKHGDGELDIIAIEDAPEVKLIKKRSEVEGLEYALKYVSNAFERGKLCARIDELKAEILILTVETYEGNN